MKKVLLLILLPLCPILAKACCAGPFYSITEVLNHNNRQYHIFTCTILETYLNNYNYESIAVVHKAFEGEPNDTVYIRSGGNSTAGGQKLLPGDQWLIVSSSKDGLHYGATVCDPLSAKIANGPHQTSNYLNDRAAIHLDALEQYERIRQRKITGQRVIKSKGEVLAKGFFKNGLPDGQWIHYSAYDGYTHEIVKSKISYKEGYLDGLYQDFPQRKKNNVVVKEQMYQLDRILWSRTQPRKRLLEYQYINGRKRRMISTYFDALGAIETQTVYIELDYDDPRYQILRIAEGQFALDRATSLNKIEIYDKDGNTRLIGQYNEYGRTGVWTYFYNQIITKEESYDEHGYKLYEKKFSGRGRETFTPFKNNVKHGQQIVKRADQTIKNIKQFENGSLQKELIFNNEGKVKEEYIYINGRKNSVLSNNQKAYYKNGLLNGFYQQKDKDGKVSLEGQYWNGYKIGIWKKYKKDGSFSKQYYETNPKKLMHKLGSDLALKYEYYDQNGKLKRISKW